MNSIRRLFSCYSILTAGPAVISCRQHQKCMLLPIHASEERTSYFPSNIFLYFFSLIGLLVSLHLFLVRGTKVQAREMWIAVLGNPKWIFSFPLSLFGFHVLLVGGTKMQVEKTWMLWGKLLVPMFSAWNTGINQQRADTQSIRPITWHIWICWRGCICNTLVAKINSKRTPSPSLSVKSIIS